MTSAKLIVALDLPNLREAEKFVRFLKPEVSWFKIGMRLFTAHGPSAVKMVRDLGGEVFLDLKFHDIPNTVARACESAVALGVSMLNVHASGGSEMLKAAAQAVGRRAKLIGVTVLTSQPLSFADEVVSLALLCREAGLDGVVCSPKEIAQVRGKTGKDFLIVTPGIRLNKTQGKKQAQRAVEGEAPSPPLPRRGGGGDASPYDDQKRVDLPSNAVKAGADFIVVGRPILESSDPLGTASQIIQEISLTR
ncbi:MAG: orotidine-5'-phosphate decarboxylase [Deltaproteobacteria bacterium]|nr:orotidine-5'-phosphate decarboxylase [Deltaproteobacteria bacterium]